MRSKEWVRRLHLFKILSLKRSTLHKPLELLLFPIPKRQGNVPAHSLAQHAASVENYVAWLEECPSHIEHTCAHDVFSFLNFE